MNIPAVSVVNNRERGFSLVTAIFVIVVMALLGVYMVTIGGAQRVTAAYAIQNARADQAARAGVEWAINRVMNPPFAAMCGLLPAPGPVTNPAFPLNSPGIEGFQVVVVCSHTQHQERGNLNDVFLITSTATSGTFGDPYFFSRTVQASVTNAP